MRLPCAEPYSPIRHLATIVCPPWMDRDKVIFVMLTFAFDAGGDDRTEVLTVAGFASSTKDWDAFSLAWKERLDRDGVTFFRAVDAAHFRGPFQHWHGLPNREQLRRALFADLMTILKQHAYRKFGCTIINGAFQQMDAALKEEFALTAYSVAGRTCEKHAREWVLAEWKNHDMPVELVFERGDKGQHLLQKRLADDNCFLPTFKPKLDTMEDGILQPGFIPLQAADWLAYELSLAMKQAESGKTVESTTELRWAMQEFLGIHGNTGVFTIEDMQQFQKMLELTKDLRAWWASFGAG